MSYQKVLILVEGQTEESFVKMVLSEFMPEGLILQPVVVATKRVNSGGKFKGGVPSYSKVKGDVLRLLGDTSAVMVTSMFDYYALPTSFPGREQPQGFTAAEKVRFVEEEWNRDVNNPRFKAYLSLHEFEALLFAKPDAIAEGFAKPEIVEDLQEICSSFSTPEEINDRPETSPSSRLQAFFPRYNKPIFGTLIARRIGVEDMKRACPHFSEWVTFLQSLG